MTLISLSYIKGTITTYRDLFIYLVDCSALKRAEGVEGLQRELSGYSVLDLPLTWTQEYKTRCHFFPCQKHYIGELPNSKGSVGSCLISCQLRLAREAAGASLQSASNRMVGSSTATTSLRAPSFPNHLLLFPFLSQQKSLQNWKNIFNKIMLEMFPSL